MKVLFTLFVFICIIVYDVNASCVTSDGNGGVIITCGRTQGCCWDCQYDLMLNASYCNWTGSPSHSCYGGHQGECGPGGNQQ